MLFLRERGHRRYVVRFRQDHSKDEMVVTVVDWNIGRMHEP